MKDVSITQFAIQFVRCDNCKHVLSMFEIVNGEPCSNCGKEVCENCGSNEFEYPCYSWQEWAVKCSKCRMEFG